MLDLLLFALLGALQIALSVYGGILAAAPPSQQRRQFHIAGFAALGSLAVVVTIWIGVLNLREQSNAKIGTNTLQANLNTANANLATANGKLDKQTGLQLQSLEDESYLKGQLSAIAVTLGKTGPSGLVNTKQLADAIARLAQRDPPTPSIETKPDLQEMSDLELQNGAKLQSQAALALLIFERGKLQNAYDIYKSASTSAASSQSEIENAKRTYQETTTSINKEITTSGPVAEAMDMVSQYIAEIYRRAHGVALPYADRGQQWGNERADRLQGWTDLASAEHRAMSLTFISQAFGVDIPRHSAH